jgi:hypothetical protein
MTGPSLLPSLSRAGRVSARWLDRVKARFDFAAGRDGREVRSSRKVANSAGRATSLSVKLAGEFRRGRSGNTEESEERRRFGERDSGTPSVSFSLPGLAELLGDKGGAILGEWAGLVRLVGTLLAGCTTDGLLVPRSGSRPKANCLLFSDCLRNCSNSGFWSTGMTRGDAAAVDRTLEVGGLQLPRMCCAALEEKQSAAESSWRPK